MITHNPKKYAAFTLIELLVVIAIIALLASIVLVALNGARVKARDAKRVADLSEIQTALELYYSDYGAYPNDSGCDSTGTVTPCWNTFLPTSYIASMPKDPLNTAGAYAYYYWTDYKPNGNCGYTNTNSTNDYMLLARLENTADSVNACTTGTISVNGNSTLNYIVGY